MNEQDVKEIKACLPKGKTPWHYYPKRYAPMLLSLVLPEPVPISRLRKSRYSKLLSAEPVRKACAISGDGLLSRDRLHAVWPARNHSFLLSLSHWGGSRRAWQQTSRPGYNLVLQINLAQSVERALKAIAHEDVCTEFNSRYHPSTRRGKYTVHRMTLAWVRMDFELDANEALIEEVQNDWVRNAYDELRWLKNHHRALKAQGAHAYAREIANPVAAMERFVDEFVAPLNKLWSEAALAAAIEFLHGEIGFKNIYYHSFETGCALKRINDSRPPRSVYTTLPERFCFERTDEPPAFLMRSAYSRREIARLENPCWYRLNLQQLA